MITANITVNLSGEPQLIRVPAKQGDVGSREVSIKFVDNGVIYSIPEGTTARIRVTKPDGKYVFNDCTIEDNAVIAPLTAQTLAVAGDARADIALYQGENELLSCSVFILAIMPRAGSDEAIESTDEFGALDSLLQQAETDIPAAHDAAEAANQAAESANEAAQTANDIAEEVEKKLENGDFVGPQGPAGSIDNVTGAATSILTDNLSANSVLISDGNGKVAASGITAAELGFLDGATSNIQSQINALNSNNTYVKVKDYITNLEIDALDDDVSDIPESENILLQLSEKIDTKADNMTLSGGFLQLTSEGDPIGSAIGLPEGGGGGTTIETIDSTEINDLFEEE